MLRKRESEGACQRGLGELTVDRVGVLWVGMRYRRGFGGMRNVWRRWNHLALGDSDAGVQGEPVSKQRGAVRKSEKKKAAAGWPPL
jgi:hypothetical protein